jgi:hypothetical protein
MLMDVKGRALIPYFAPVYSCSMETASVQLLIDSVGVIFVDYCKLQFNYRLGSSAVKVRNY